MIRQIASGNIEEFDYYPRLVERADGVSEKVFVNGGPIND